MSGDEKEGGCAFPCEHYRETGMTLRDYFAAKAAQGMLTTSGAASLNGLDGYEAVFAAAAYKIADAMLKARQS